MTSSLYMAKPVGGRGKAAPKPTIMRRIPEGIKEAVEQLADLYRDDEWDGNLENLISSSDAPNKPDINFEAIQQELAELRQWKAEREDMDREVERLSTKVGDLDLEKQILTDQLEQTQAELVKVRSHQSEPTANIQLPEPAELLNQFRKKLPKSKISLREVEMLLELL